MEWIRTHRLAAVSLVVLAVVLAVWLFVTFGLSCYATSGADGFVLGRECP